jgi:site-specific DNA recombinase
MPIAPEHLHLAYQGPFPAVIYGRASRDPKKRGRSVDAQLLESRRTCNDNDWPIVREFRDDDRSASRHAKKKRDDFEEMLEVIGSGECRIVLAFEASRYYRDLEVYIRLRNACAANGVLLCYNGTVYDLSKRGDRNATAMDALRAEDEVEGIRDRNLRTSRQLAEAGRPFGQCPDGYTRSYDPQSGDLIEQLPHPERAELVREMFTWVAAGKSIRQMYLSLNDRGLTTRRGYPWTHHAVLTILRNPAYIGRRIHQGRDVGQATWPALVDEDLFYAVQAVLSGPGRVSQRGSEPVHLLSGIALCGECKDEQPLRVIRDSARREKQNVTCPKFHAAMSERLMVPYVETALLAWLGSEQAAEAFRTDEADSEAAEARGKMQRLTQQLEEARQLAAEFDEEGLPKLSVVSLAGLERQLLPKIEAARQIAESRHVPPLLRDLAGNPDVDAVWESLEMRQRRAVVREVVTIRLYKARTRGCRTIEPGRITMAFVGQPGFKRGD